VETLLRGGNRRWTSHPAFIQARSGPAFGDAVRVAMRQPLRSSRQFAGRLARRFLSRVGAT